METGCPTGMASQRNRDIHHRLFAKLTCLAIAALALAVITALARQNSQATFSVHVETQLVQVHVRVLGRDGTPVPGLNKNNFSVKENGRQREVVSLDYVPVAESVEESSQPGQAAANTGQASGHRVWIYVDSEADSDEVPQTYQAIKQFLTSQLRPGFKVSLDGLPFTDDRAKLLATIEKMRQGPYGRLPDVPPLINSTLDMEKQADYEWLADSAVLFPRSTAPPPGFGNLIMRPGLAPGGASLAQIQLAETKLDLKNVEQEMSFYVRTSLFRYLDIVYRLEALQGDKFVVIFRSGLRMDPASILLLHRFAADALRHRIAFYTVDTRGLLTINPSTNRVKLMRYGVTIPQSAQNNWLQFLNALNDYSRTEQLEAGREEGLKDVAKLTGGQAVTNTNDLGTVFNDLLEDASGYYVVGFYPAENRQLGRFRSLKISVNVPGAKSYAPKGYYEPLPLTEMSKREKDILLWRALESDMPRDLPVAASINVFRGDDGEPVAIVSTGVKLGALAAKHVKDASRVQVTELEQIKAADAGIPPVYHGQNATVTIANPVFSEASASPTEFVTFNTKIPVSPGKHVCKVVFRDNNTGKLGTEEVQFVAPDYGQAPATSTLLITRQVKPLSGDNASGKSKNTGAKPSDLLEAGQTDFMPQPDPEFYTGDKIYLLYDLYNPPSYDFGAIVRSVHTGLVRNGAPIRQFHIDWRILPDPDKKMAVLIGTLDTDGYAPGDYRVIQSLPAGPRPSSASLVANFTLLAK